MSSPGSDQTAYTFDDSVKVSPDGKCVAISGTYDGNPYSPDRKPSRPLRLIDVATQCVVRNLEGTSGRPIGFSPDGKTLLVSGDTGEISAYDIVNLKRRWKTTGAANGFFLTPDRVLCEEADGKYRERNSLTGQILRTWSKRLEPGYVLGLKRVGSRFLTGIAIDQKMNVWDVQSHRKQLLLAIPALPDRTSMNWLAYTPQGFYNGSPGVEKFLRWRLGTQLEMGSKWKSRFYNPAAVAKALKLRSSPKHHGQAAPFPPDQNWLANRRESG